MNNSHDSGNGNLADAKSRFANATASADAATTATIINTENGLTFWLVGKTMVVTPALNLRAPREARHWLHDRAVANATGRCPRCGAAASVTSHTHAEMAHEDDCNIGTCPRKIARWLDRRAAYAIELYNGSLT